MYLGDVSNLIGKDVKQGDVGRNGRLTEGLLSLTVSGKSLDQSNEDDVDFDVTVELGTSLQVGM